MYYNKLKINTIKKYVLGSVFFFSLSSNSNKNTDVKINKKVEKDKIGKLLMQHRRRRSFNKSMM
jgi:hypothetical protein